MSVAGLAVLRSPMSGSGDADLLLLDAEIWTGDATSPRARALAAKDGVLITVGTNDQAERWRGTATDVLELDGAFVCPGFIDAHAHLAQLAGSLFWLRLDGRSRAEVLDRVRRARANQEWIVGRGWDESTWRDRRYLGRHELDTASGKTPVVLVRVDGHMLSCNTAALERLRVPKKTRGFESGGDGTATGVLKEEAAEAALARLRPTANDILAGIPKAIRRLHRLGITSVHDMVTANGLQAWVQWRGSGRTGIRVSAFLETHSVQEKTALRGEPLGDKEWLRFGGVKVYSDGSLGARTAALDRPYADDRRARGFLIHSPVALKRLAARAHSRGHPLAVHAIGDRANLVVARTLAALGARRHRHRIEHFELPTWETMRIVKSSGIIASMQPNFAGRWSAPGQLYEARLGERFRGNNPFREILDRRIPLCFGSDGMPYGPLYGMHSAVNAPFESQRITAEEALRAYTAGGAFASHEERRKGTLGVGKLADLVVLDRSPLKHPKEIRRLKVLATIVGGRVAYLRPGKP